MKRRNALSVGQIIDQAFEAAGVTREAAGHRICAVWPDVVGPGVNRMTYKRHFAEGTLYVYLSSAVLKNELSFHRDRLVESLNRAASTDILTDIQFL